MNPTQGGAFLLLALCLQSAGCQSQTPAAPGDDPSEAEPEDVKEPVQKSATQEAQLKSQNPPGKIACPHPRLHLPPRGAVHSVNRSRELAAVVDVFPEFQEAPEPSGKSAAVSWDHQSPPAQPLVVSCGSREACDLLSERIAQVLELSAPVRCDEPVRSGPPSTAGAHHDYEIKSSRCARIRACELRERGAISSACDELTDAQAGCAGLSECTKILGCLDKSQQEQPKQDPPSELPTAQPVPPGLKTTL